MSDGNDNRQGGRGSVRPSDQSEGHGSSSGRDDEIDPDAPASAEEVAASQRLRDALEGKTATAPGTSGDSDVERDVALAKSLRAAWAPSSIDEGVHAEMLDDLPTAEELVLAAELRDALDANTNTDANKTKAAAALPDVVVALRSAWNPAALSDEEHRAILVQTVVEERGVTKVIPFRARTMRVVVVTTTSVLALAASVIVWITTAPPQGNSNEAPLAKARSTQPLFDEPFKAGETSARIDKIAMARASDYRDNRFAKWGVR